MKTGLKYVRGDRLIAVFRDPESGKIYKQGKRVGKACPLTKTERVIYVKKGPVACVAYISRIRVIPLREAKELLDAAR